MKLSWKNCRIILSGLLGLTIVTMGESAKSDALTEVTAGSEKFALDLYMQLKGENENMIMSPLGVQIVLAMVASGAKGDTLNELIKSMHYPSDLQTLRSGYQSLLAALQAPELKMANSIFVDKQIDLLSDFSADMVTYFTSAIEKLPFQTDPSDAAASINNWAEKNTNGKIKDLFKGDELKDAMVVLANAIHFKAKWKYQFLPQMTKDSEFHTSKTTHVMVKMMSIKGRFRYGYVPELQSKILELPYENDRFRMVIILPDDIEGLSVVETKLHSIGIAKAMDYLHPETVEVKIPRFKIESDTNLVDALMKLGLKKLFGPECDLAGITAFKTKVTKAKQKAFIEVNEEGTEAAAVTAIITALCGRIELKVEFEARHPFIAVVKYGDEGTLDLFYSKVCTLPDSRTRDRVVGKRAVNETGDSPVGRSLKMSKIAK